VSAKGLFSIETCGAVGGGAERNTVAIEEERRLSIFRYYSNLV